MKIQVGYLLPTPASEFNCTVQEMVVDLANWLQRDSLLAGQLMMDLDLAAPRVLDNTTTTSTTTTTTTAVGVPTL